MDKISARVVTDKEFQKKVEESLISKSKAAQLCPAKLPKIAKNATYSDLIKRAQKDSLLYEECALRQSTLVDAIKKKEESVDLSPVGQQSL